MKDHNVTTGTFTYLLSKGELRSRLASCGVSLLGQICDETWWKTYAEELEGFRRLRNTCCHCEPLSWQQEEQLIEILFERQEFIKTLVGDDL